MSSPSTIAGGPSERLPGARTSLFLLLLINLFNYIDRYILAAVEPLISAEFFPPGSPGEKDAKTRMGLLATAFMVSYMVFSPVFGHLADRTRRWWVIGAGVALWSLASGGSGLATGFGALLLMRVLIGVGEAAYGPTAPTIIADLFPVARRGGVMSWFYAAIPVGSALGYVLGGTIGNRWGWHWAFLWTLPPGLALAAWCFLRREVSRGAADGGGAPHAIVSRGQAFRDLVRCPSFVLNTLGMTAMTFAIGGISFWAPTYFSEYRMTAPADPAALADMRAQVSATFGGIVVVGGLLATLAGGYTADRLRRRYPGSYFLVSGLSMLAGFPFFLGVLYAPFPLAWVFMFLAVFCLFFNTGPSNTIIANVTHPSVRATAFAITIFCIHAFGDAVSPAIIGRITDSTRGPAHPAGNMTLAFLVVGGSIVLGGVFWLLGTRHLARDTARTAGGAA